MNSVIITVTAVARLRWRVGGEVTTDCKPLLQTGITILSGSSIIQILKFAPKASVIIKAIFHLTLKQATVEGKRSILRGRSIEQDQAHKGVALLMVSQVKEEERWDKGKRTERGEPKTHISKI